MLVYDPPQAWVLCLGDSNTKIGAWRGWLYENALADGKYLKFMGSQTEDRSGYVLQIMPWHEGHGGYTSLELEAEFLDWANTYHRVPDYILMSAGTNDIDQSIDDPENMTTLINTVAGKFPSSRIIVGTIPPWTAKQSQVDTWNAALPDVVSSRAAAGINIEFYNSMAGLVAPDDLQVDGVHLSLTEGGGAYKLANNWWSRLSLG